MRYLSHFSDPDRLFLCQCEQPEPQEKEVRIRVVYAGINRPDLYQRQGLYLPPEGASPILGLEVSGYIEAVGPGVSSDHIGRRVCALVNGGGYAEYVVCPAIACLTLPDHVSFAEGCGIPEAWFTAALFLWHLCPISADQSILVHGMMANVSRAAIRLALWRGASVMSTIRSSRHKQDSQLLAAEQILMIEELQQLSERGKRFNAIFDVLGAGLFRQNCRLLAQKGTLLCVGFLDSSRSDLSLTSIVMKQLTIRGATMRSQPYDVRKSIAEFLSKAWQQGLLLESTVFLDRVFQWDDANEAYSYFESGKTSGKVVLQVSED